MNMKMKLAVVAAIAALSSAAFAEVLNYDVALNADAATVDGFGQTELKEAALSAANNVAFVQQDTSNNSAYVAQVGNTNYAGIAQGDTTGSLAVVQQTGDLNRASVYQVTSK